MLTKDPDPGDPKRPGPDPDLQHCFYPQKNRPAKLTKCFR